MKVKVFFLIAVITALSLSAVSSGAANFPKIVWVNDFNTPIIDHYFSPITAKTAVLTSKFISLHSAYGNQIWRKEINQRFRNIRLSNRRNTVLLLDNFAKKYRALNQRTNVDYTNSYQGYLRPTNQGEYLLNWKAEGKTIDVYNLEGRKIRSLGVPGFWVQDIKLSSADDYVLALGIENGTKQMRKFALRGEYSEKLPAQLQKLTLDELVLSGNDRYVGVSDAIYDLNKRELIVSVRAKVMAITNNKQSYLSIDNNKRTLSYNTFSGQYGVWQAEHLLDQWQEVYIDSKDRFVLTLSYLRSAIEYTVELFDIQGQNKLTWRLDWHTGDRITVTSDLRYALVKQRNRLTMYQLY